MTIGEVHRIYPEEVRGGILADSMGLGKSLSMISLLANDWPHYKVGSSEVVPTLLVVPPSLLRTWDDEFRKHLHPGTLRCWKYHGPKRSMDLVSILAYDIVITTYDVVATEWKSLEKGPRPLFSIKWRRIILDEGKLLCLRSIKQANPKSIAHEIRVGATLRAKAIYALRGHIRWAVTGTPIQNKWDDLASLLSFLRVYPNLDTKSLTTMLRQNTADPELRSMLALLCLRRSKQTIDLPDRRDTTHKVKFDEEEAAYYKSINFGATKLLDQQVRQTNLRSYSNILPKINTLRQICNLGRYYQDKIEIPETQSTVMQELFDGMVSTGIALCCRCGSDLSRVDERFGLQSGGICDIESWQIRMTTCGETICGSCFATSGMIKCPSMGTCRYQDSCKLFSVDPSSSSSLSAYQPNSRLPTKMRALQQDTLALPEEDKR